MANLLETIAARQAAVSMNFLPPDADAMCVYLQRTGRPISCRLEFKLTSLEELKKAAHLISELNKRLDFLAYESEADPMLRVLVARSDIEACRLDLKVWHAQRGQKPAAKPAAPTLRRGRPPKK